MSFKTEWVAFGSRVLTRNGPGRLVSLGGMGGEVELDKSWAGSRFLFVGEPGEASLESDFTLVRIINLTSFAPTLIMSAQNYPSWEECLKALEEPYASNETLLALNFKSKIFESNRRIESEDPYQILETALSIYRQSLEAKFYSFLEEAQAA